MARELVGALLVADAGGPLEVRARIVEVEAYLGPGDPASHAARGPTPRAAIMFGEPARLYVYLSYGLHHCANLVTEPAGRAGAVLLRAAAVDAGEEVVRARRAGAPRRGQAAGWRDRAEPRWGAVPEVREPFRGLADGGSPARRLAAASLLRGPGNLCRALGLTLADNGLDLGGPGARLRVLPAEVAPPLTVGPRVGISVATEAALRYSWTGHPSVSRAGSPPLAGRAPAPGHK